MNKIDEVAVTLTPELFDRLRTEADSLGVSITWLVASLIVDTMDKVAVPPPLLS